MLSFLASAFGLASKLLSFLTMRAERTAGQQEQQVADLRAAQKGDVNARKIDADVKRLGDDALNAELRAGSRRP